MNISRTIYLYKAGMLHRLVTAFVDCADGFPYPLTNSTLDAIRSCASSLVICQVASMPALDLGLRMFRPRAIKSRVENLSFDMANAIVDKAKHRKGSIDTHAEFSIIMVGLALEILEAIPPTGAMSNWDDRTEYSYLTKGKHGSNISEYEWRELDDSRRSISYELIKYVGQLNLTDDERRELNDISSLLQNKYQELLSRK